MKRILFCLVALVLAQGVHAGDLVWHDGAEFPLYGKISEETETRYERLPASLHGVCRDRVWELGTNTPGLFLRFRSDSPTLAVRWEARDGNNMPHMTDVGTRGMDLYTLLPEGWRFVGSAVPAWDGSNPCQTTILDHAAPLEREYMLYLPLYDGITSLEIGIAVGASIAAPAVIAPSTRNRPVVMYGTSILQGACASRPGMAFTNILSRRLDRVVYNLGFSGNALLDMEIARLMASVADPAVFVLDYAPNAWDYLIEEKGEAFFRILRDAHPDVPVIFVEDVTFPHTLFDAQIRAEVEGKNRAQRALYEKLKKQGEKNLYYIPTTNLIGTDGEATVEGIHFTDLGMVRYADVVEPVIRKAIRRRC